MADTIRLMTTFGAGRTIKRPADVTGWIRVAREHDGGFISIHQSGQIRIYGPPNDAGVVGAYLGRAIDHGLFETSPTRQGWYGFETAGVKTSDKVFDIENARGIHVIKGCITSTLWQHIREKLIPEVHSIQVGA